MMAWFLNLLLGLALISIPLHFAEAAKPEKKPLIRELAQKVAEADPNQPTDELGELHNLLFEEVKKELEAEAKTAKKSRDQYADSDEAFSRFVESTMKIDIEKLSKVDAVIATIKTGHRLQIHGGGRFQPHNFDEGAAKVRVKVLELSVKSGLISKTQADEILHPKQEEESPGAE